MKKRLLLLLFFFVIAAAGCTKEEFKMENITVAQLQEKIKNDDSFVLLVEREDCPYCEALNEYLEQTKQEHPDQMVYVLDVTPLDLKKPTQEAKTLVSDLPEGKQFLKLQPFYYYSPTMYRYEKGKATEAGIGFNVNSDAVALWDVTSSADLQTAEPVGVWEFIEG